MIIAGSALLLAGFGGGAAVMVISSASADETSVSSTEASGGAGETALTGNTLTKVTDAVLAEYPGATIDRAETDNGGVYEAHITTADGDDLTVLINGDFAISGTETGGHGGHGGGAGETPLAGTTLTKVTDAVLAEYPGATIDRAETDNGGVYEAHITTADGDALTVLVGDDFTVTGTDTGH
jgi:uncharacterized membrane protein YkoI